MLVQLNYHQSIFAFKKTKKKSIYPISVKIRTSKYKEFDECRFCLAYQRLSRCLKRRYVIWEYGKQDRTSISNLLNIWDTCGRAFHTKDQFSPTSKQESKNVTYERDGKLPLITPAAGPQIFSFKKLLTSHCPKTDSIV